MALLSPTALFRGLVRTPLKGSRIETQIVVSNLFFLFRAFFQRNFVKKTPKHFDGSSLFQ